MASDLEKVIGHTFGDPALLRLALTHSSCAGDNYERLEFLGDALLDFAVGEYLYRRHPDWAEGRLTTERAAMVSNDRLADVFDRLCLRPAIRALNLPAQPSQKVKANFVESLLGAIYLDAGKDAADAFIRDFVLLTEQSERDTFDYVSSLLHVMRVQYTDVRIDDAADIGTVNAPRFAVSVWQGDSRIGYGEAPSKHDARYVACKAAWLFLNR